MKALTHHGLKLIGLLILMVSCQSADERLKRMDPPAKLIQESSLRSEQENQSSNPNQATLSQQTPITTEVMKSWLPTQMENYQRTQLLSGHRAEADITAILASYQHKDRPERTIKVEIFDGAGKNGSLLIQAANERLKYDIEESKNDSKSRIYSKNLLRVRETEIPNQQYTEIEFVDQNRFHYQLKGFGIALDQLWSFAESANFI
ncbi:hypothetical protein [Algoriphagus namhaensis]